LGKELLEVVPIQVVLVVLVLLGALGALVVPEVRLPLVVLEHL